MAKQDNIFLRPPWWEVHSFLAEKELDVPGLIIVLVGLTSGQTPVFDAKVTIRGTLHTLVSIKELLGQSVNERRRTRYKIGNNNFEFGRQEFFLITGFAFGKIPKVDTFKGLQNSPFHDRVFPDKIAEPLKKVRVSDLLELIRKPKIWSALSDEDSVK
ncbi:hypothetical protein Tco_0936264, partial [Tanacetum coccineum]